MKKDSTPEGREDWIPWTPGPCPVDPNTMVEIKAIMPGETEERVLFQRMAWASVWDSPKVTAYRVVRP